MTSSGAKPSRILVVDDEPIVCDSIRMLLTFDGHSVRCAGSGREALEIFVPGEFDVLMTDYAMPGMTGAELAATIRPHAPDLRIILVTAYAEMLNSWGADLTSINWVLSKPFRLEDLRVAMDGAPVSG